MREKRNEHLMVHVTPAMKARVLSQASARGLTLSALLNLILSENLAKYEKSVVSESAGTTGRDASPAKVESPGHGKY
jgi:hypothetical protein